jgi:hypothetical protein
MKKMSFYLLVLAFLISLTMLLPGARAKDIDLSFTAGWAYDRGIWGSGMYNSPTGTHRDEWSGMNFAGQIKYRGWIFEKYQPTFEVGYRQESFDFSDWEAPIQRADPIIWHFLIGLTHDFGKGYSGYLLGGITEINHRPSLIETQSNPILYHGRDIGIPDQIPTFKIGGYKLWNLGNLKIGPEISTEIFTRKPGFSRCRKFETSLFVPSIGIRIQW